jgi:hypothetical protein
METLDRILRGGFDAEVDEFAALDPQLSHRTTPQPGVLAFRELILGAYPETGCLGIIRSPQTPGRSEHKEGRAWDWRVCRQCQGRQASQLLGWLMACDGSGEPCAAARRLGIMYIIWDSRIWGAYAAEEGWRAYKGPNPHTDHVHFSFSWRGALARTSWWSARPGIRLPLSHP